MSSEFELLTTFGILSLLLDRSRFALDFDCTALFLQISRAPLPPLPNRAPPLPPPNRTPPPPLPLVGIFAFFFNATVDLDLTYLYLVLSLITSVACFTRANGIVTGLIFPSCFLANFSTAKKEVEDEST